jgi:hypothetical protein
MSFNHVQPTLILDAVMKARPDKGNLAPVGTVLPIAPHFHDRTNTWLKCHGQTMRRTEYSELFSVLGHSFSHVPVPETWIARQWRLWVTGKPAPTRLACAEDEFILPDFRGRITDTN